MKYNNWKLHFLKAVLSISVKKRDDRINVHWKHLGTGSIFNFIHRPKIDYTKSVEEALKLSQKINEALAKHDKKVRPNAGGKNNLHASFILIL